MKKSEYYQNKFPLEDILPEIDEKSVNDIVNNCDYTFEADRIAIADFPDIPQAKVNTADAIVFYQMGYEDAKNRIEKALKPINTI